MKNVKFYWLLLLFTLLGLVVGCNQRQNNNLDNYFVGKDGVGINFLQGYPGQPLFNNKGYDLVLEIKNNGAYPSYPNDFVGKIYFDGYNEEIIEITPKEKPLRDTLYGRRDNTPLGTIYREYFKLKTKDMNSEVHTTNILAHVCYKYQTYGLLGACIKQNPTTGDNTIEDNVCKEGDQTLKEGQGAPVTITKVTEIISSDLLYFDVYIKNEGLGVVFLVDQIDACPKELNYKNSDILEVKADIIGLEEGECIPKKVRLIDNEGYFTCKFKKPSEIVNPYESSLEITLDYGYYISEPKEIKIVKR